MIENINNTNAASTPNAVEAVWYIIQSQSAAVRKAIFKRIIDADKEEKKRRQQKMVKDSLYTALDELAEAKRTGRKLPDARKLFD